LVYTTQCVTVSQYLNRRCNKHYADAETQIAIMWDEAPAGKLGAGGDKKHGEGSDTVSQTKWWQFPALGVNDQWRSGSPSPPPSHSFSPPAP